eukprot:scaffold12161_cov81-Skeletonema_dohrnii-CCMP3373.AAC.2
MAADGWYNYDGREAVPDYVTRVRIDKSLTVIPARAFRGHQNIRVVECHDRNKTVDEEAFLGCRSLWRVIMPGVEVVEKYAFLNCLTLTDIECGKLDIIGGSAFAWCKSLRSITLPSAKIVEMCAFDHCTALTNVKFGDVLESIGYGSFSDCTSLERITIPLKNGMITRDNIFQRCVNLERVDLVEGAILDDTIDALLLEGWKNDICREIVSIKQILPTAPAGDDDDVGGKAEAIRTWIRSVLGKIIHYKAENQRYLKEAAITLEHALWKKRLSEINVPERDDQEERAKCRVKCGSDIVIKNVLPFL